MYSVIILLIIVFIQFSASEIFVQKESEVLANYVKFVYENFLKSSQGYVGLVVNDNDNHAVEKSLIKIHDEVSNSFVLINFSNFEQDKPVIEQLKTRKLSFGFLKLLIIFIKTIDELHPVMKNLLFLPLYRTRNQILIIFDQALNKEEVIEIFKYCWEKKFLNIILIYLLYEKIQVFSYNPFLKRSKMLQNFTKTLYETNLYYDKLKNIHAWKIICLIIRDDDYTKIRVVKNKDGIVVGYSGLDVDIIKNLVSVMNGTVRFVNSQKPAERNPWRNTNEVSNTTLEKKREIILENKADMLNADEMVLNDDFSGVTESLYPHDKDDLVFILKRGEKIPYFKYLFMIFRFDLWCYIIVSALIIILFWVFIVCYFKMSCWKMEIMLIFRTIVGGASPRIPETGSERVMFLFWSFYCFIIALGFQSKLTDMLMEPKYYPDITTLKELENSGQKVHLYLNIIQNLNKSLTGTSKEGLLKQMVKMPSEFDPVNNTLVKYSMSIFSRPTVVAYNRAVYGTRSTTFCSNTRTLLNIIEESPLPRYMALQVAAGSPYLKRLETTMAKFKEYGFLKYWDRKWKFYAVIKKLVIPENYNFNMENAEYIAMTINHLNAAFIILISGILLSCLVFLIELIKRKL